MTEQSFKNLTLNSSFEEIERLEPYLQKLQVWAGFGDGQMIRIQMAVNEAATNAIIHGNKEDSSKKVEVSARKDCNTLKITVRDEGPGFDPDSLPDPLQEENLLKDSGRGVFLIKQYADEVEFSKNATKLTMHFKLDEE